MTKELLDKIEQRASNLGIKISAVLSEAGVDYSTWWRWRKGETSPTVKSIMVINEVLDHIERQSASA